MITLIRTLSLGGLLVLTGCANELVDDDDDDGERPIANTSAALATGGGAPVTNTCLATTGAPLPQGNDYDCTCVERRRGGAEYEVASCDNARDRCSDVSVIADCQENPNGPDCDYLVSCECNCTAQNPTTEFDHGPYDDVLLTGIPDLWQFDYMCGGGDSNVASANAVGCGPVSAAMVIYHWAMQGYEGLVSDFLAANGAGAEGPAELKHDWIDLVKELRSDYMNGGICEPFTKQYAVLMHDMAPAIRDYIQDAGYAVDVDHYKVCRDCNAGGDNELRSAQGLNLIKHELEAGRPVIMGFNAGPTFKTYVDVAHDGGIERVFTGELSNGTPALGTINHYAVITGYRRIDGTDVLTLNAGWADDATDHQVMWNPAGKWLHLYTVDITSRPDGEEWCSIDRGVDENFNPPKADAFTTQYIEISHVEASTPSCTNELTPLAGTSCGIAREGNYITYYDTTRQLEMCPTDLPEEIDVNDLDSVHSPSPQNGAQHGDVPIQTGPTILDEERPLP